MAQITFKGDPVETVGELPAVGSKAPEFKLTTGELADVSLEDYAGKKKIISIVPSLDTGVCAASARAFNEKAAQIEDTVILNVSADLPFAAGRFCEAEGIDRVVTLSTFRAPSFGDDYGVKIASGPLAGLMSRAVLVLSADNEVVYAEQVPEIAQEPDYGKALEAAQRA
jgi:thiol peroxidase